MQEKTALQKAIIATITKPQCIEHLKRYSTHFIALVLKHPISCEQEKSEFARQSILNARGF